ncbi:hypothetical protein FWH13_02985 [Candidatus Saccharibacteria bacterium]|nr:hypothetical protein [Candidatus Saccharibacteria bacterium]
MKPSPKTSKPARHLSEGLIIALNLATLIAYLIAATHLNVDAYILTIWASALIIFVLNLMFILTHGRSHSLPIRPLVFLTSISLVLAKITTPFALVILIPSHTPAIFGCLFLLALFYDFLFFRALHLARLTFPIFQTYLFTTILLFILLVTPVFTLISTDTGSVDSWFDFIIAVAIISIVAGLITALAHKLSSLIPSPLTNNKSKER